MNVRAYEEDSKSDLYLKLDQSDDRVLLRVVDSRGQVRPQGILLSIEDDLTVRIHAGVSEVFGFRLDSKGRILMDEDT